MQLLITALLLSQAFACTNFIVSAGASADGAPMITYAADSHTIYGYLKVIKSEKHKPGSTVEVIDPFDGSKHGVIDQVPHTYGVVGGLSGGASEMGVAIGETTFDGPPFKCASKAQLSYGPLIWFALQRAESARDAIMVMKNLTDKYGYLSDSSGESFSIADTKEAWVMDLVARGDGGPNNNPGMAFVACKIPDGHISGHANQARIQTFYDNPDCIFPDDLFEWAEYKGIFDPSKDDKSTWSWSDSINPLNFEDARFCELRVWSWFHNAGWADASKYEDYASGRNLTHRMPLSVKPGALVTLNKTMEAMRDHLEGTPFEFTSDVGAQAFQMPYRWRPLTFKSGGHTYFNERTVGTQQTGFSFVAHLRPTLPTPLGAVLWFGVDDTASTVWAPVYTGSQFGSKAWAGPDSGPGGIMKLSLREPGAFNIFNMVSNWAYVRYDLVYPDVKKAVNSMEKAFMAELIKADKAVYDIYKVDKEAGLLAATEFTVRALDDLVEVWITLFEDLFVKYLDGNVKTPSSNPLVPNVAWPGYGTTWQDLIAKTTGDRYLEPGTMGPQRRVKGV